MEGGVIDERIGNKRGRDEKGSMGRLEKRPSGMVVIEDYSGDEMINGVKYEEEKTTDGGGGGGGLFNQLIANLVNSPKSNQQAEAQPEKNGDGEGGGEGHGIVSNGGEVVVDKDGGGQVEENEEDGGGDIVAQLPTSLSDVFKIEDTGPATDEASILLHSIIHD